MRRAGTAALAPLAGPRVPRDAPRVRGRRRVAHRVGASQLLFHCQTIAPCSHYVHPGGARRGRVGMGCAGERKRRRGRRGAGAAPLGCAEAPGVRPLPGPPAPLRAPRASPPPRRPHASLPVACPSEHWGVEGQWGVQGEARRGVWRGVGRVGAAPGCWPALAAAQGVAAPGGRCPRGKARPQLLRNMLIILVEGAGKVLIGTPLFCGLHSLWLTILGANSSSNHKSTQEDSGTPPSPNRCTESRPQHPRCLWRMRGGQG